MGYVEELGVGRRTLLKYGHAYFDGRDELPRVKNWLWMLLELILVIESHTCLMHRVFQKEH